MGWLGEVPRHWAILGLGKLVTLMRNGSSAAQIDEIDGALPVTRIETISSGKIDLAQVGYVMKSQIARRYRLEWGDIQFSNINSLRVIGNCAMFEADIDLYAGMNLLQIRPDKETVAPQFLCYLLKSSGFRRLVEASAKPAINQASIPTSTLKMLRVVRPPLNEQCAIASFLDREVAKIDALVHKQELLITLLEEKRQAVISHLVFGTGASNTAKLGHYIDLLAGYAFSSDEFSPDYSGLKLLRGVNVGVGEVRWDDVVFWNQSEMDTVKRFALEVGDIVFGMDRPWISSGARVATIVASDLPAMLVQRVARIRALDEMDSGYLRLLLGSREYRTYVEADLTGVSVPHISPDQIKGFRFPVKTLAEQKAVSRTIGEEERLTQMSIDFSRRAIDLAKERRTALISAAVTGKIDVREAV